MHPLLKYSLRTVAGATVAGAACVAYAAAYEVRAYRLRRFNVPVLAPGSRPLRILHLSDLHLMPDQRDKIEWVRGLAALEPDLVVTTGDNFSHPDSVPLVLRAYEPLLELPGVFVFGSNDYYTPSRFNPTRYLWRKKGPRPLVSPRLPTERLRAGFAEAGWLDLNNAKGELKADGRRLAFAGVDDPHMHADRYEEVAGPADTSAEVTIGVTHAPYRRVLDAMVGDGYRLLLAGHTHGGQLCVPGYGALVTNCDLDTGRAKGLSRWGPSWLHVSAGLGTSPYARVRFACYPEASLLTLRSAL
ncbi:metallophosphoesterase [Actinopolymorpha pittospori]|uniref:MPP superfamily phosphohydrolase n=1 Tax=Actinopolymorpha pittospori TaxID=648752 RepID=A0A927MU22_9ACTN|nr:putative MPP superfamily phosphohydrolase [Actinopolymorpha pittospori]